jgi:type IV pilus assembly protein PilW
MKPAAFRSRVKGFTLIELMISMVIGLVVVGAVLVSVIGSRDAGRFQAAYAQMNEDAQIGLSMLSRDIQMAGYALPTGLAPDPLPATTSSLVSTTLAPNAYIFGCDNGFVDPVAAGLVCNGPPAPPAPPPTLSAIMVSYEADQRNTVLTTSGTIAPSDCLGNGIAVGPPYVANNRYFISQSAAAGNRPELYCASGAASQPLIENIEDMKIWYGLSEPPAAPRQVVRYVTATDIAATGAGAAGAAQWANVVSVRICLLVRSAEPVLKGGDEGTLTYLDCDGAPQTSASNDRFLRRAYFTTATLRIKMPN